MRGILALLLPFNTIPIVQRRARLPVLPTDRALPSRRRRILRKWFRCTV